MLSAEERRRIKAATPNRPVLTPGGLRLAAAAAVALAIILALVVLNPFQGVPWDGGSVAPDFTLVATTGETVSSSSLRGRPVVLEFMDVDCSYCQEEAHDVLAPLHRDYGSRVAFVSIGVNFVGSPDTVERIEAFKTAHSTPWTYALDTAGSTASAYGVTGTPTTFILDSRGLIKVTVKGRAAGGYADYATALEAALRG